MKLEIESENSHILGLAAKTLRYFPGARGIHKEKAAITVVWILQES